MGDWIKVGQTEGEVIEINWRAVRLKTRERDVIVIPNGNLGKDTIQNYTLIDPPAFSAAEIAIFLFRSSQSSH